MANKPAPAENKMGVMPVGKLLANMAVPMMISMLVQALYNVVDSVFVARISENALTAVSLAFPLQNLMFSIILGTAVGVNALISRALGAREQDRADRTACVGIFLALCSFVVFALLGVFFTHTFFALQTNVNEIVDYGTAYSRICLCCSFGVVLQIMFERLLQSTGRTHLAMTTQLIGALTNIVLDPILIFGLLGAPRLEVAGAAVATVIGQCTAAVCALVMNLKKNPDLHLHFRYIRFHGPTVLNIYRIGLPSILMMCIGSVMTFLLNRILLAFTTTATAVFGAYFNKTIKLAVCTAMCIMAVGTLLFECIPGALLTLFDASENMLAIGVPALRIIGIHFVIAGFCIPAGSVCQAIGNPMYSLIVSVCRQLVVLIPAAWLLAQSGNLDLVWFAFPIAEVMSFILSSVFLRRTLRRADAVMAIDAAEI